MAKRKPVTAAQGKEELARLKKQNDKKEADLGLSKTLERVATANPGDEEAFAVIQDVDFMNLDNSIFEPYFDRANVEYEPDKYAYRWENTDHRRTPRWQNLGWRPVAGGRIRRGDAICVYMPIAMNQAMKAQIAERVKLKQDAPMKRFEQEVVRAGGEVFTGNKSLRDGLD